MKYKSKYKKAGVLPIYAESEVERIEQNLFSREKRFSIRSKRWSSEYRQLLYFDLFTIWRVTISHNPNSYPGSCLRSSPSCVAVSENKVLGTRCRMIWEIRQNIYIILAVACYTRSLIRVKLFSLGYNCNKIIFLHKL